MKSSLLLFAIIVMNAWYGFAQNNIPYEYKATSDKGAFVPADDQAHDFTGNTFSLVISGVNTATAKTIFNSSYMLTYKEGTDAYDSVSLKKILQKTTPGTNKTTYSFKKAAVQNKHITCAFIVLTYNSQTAVKLLHSPNTSAQNCVPPENLRQEQAGTTGETIQAGFTDCKTEIKHTPISRITFNKTECDTREKEYSAKSKFYYYDFKYKTFLNIDKKPVAYSEIKLKSGEQLQLKILNINRYIYDIGIEGSNVSYRSEPPVLFKQLFIGDSLGILGGLLNNFSTSISQSAHFKSAKPKTATNPINDKYCKFKTALVAFNDAYNALEEEKLKAYYVCDTFPCCGDGNFGLSYAAIANRMLDVRLALADLQVSIDNDAKTSEARKILNAYLAQLKTCQETDDALAVLNDKMKPLKALKEPSDEQAEELAGLQKDADELSEKKCSKALKETIQQGISLQQEELRFATSLNNLQASLPSETELKKLYLFVTNIRQQHSTFITPPMQIKGNRFELLITTKPNDSSLVSKWDIMPLYNDSLFIDLPISGGRKPFISFSSGPFMGLGMQNKTYSWQPVSNNIGQVTDTSRFTLVDNGYSFPPIGLAAFMHVEWKTGEAFGLGLSTGAGLTIEKEPRLAYFLGGSLFFGDLHQLTITGGVAGTKVNKLLYNLQSVSDREIVYDASLRPAIAYYSEFKIGGFVSLSYTLFNTDKKPVFKAAKRNR